MHAAEKGEWKSGDSRCREGGRRGGDNGGGSDKDDEKSHKFLFNHSGTRRSLAG